jgi:hypothetical protein
LLFGNQDRRYFRVADNPPRTRNFEHRIPDTDKR